MPDLDKFCDRMRYWCDEGNLGYDQSNRWDIRYGGECDCSSLVIHCLKEAGFDTGSASYTGDLADNLCARGWYEVKPDGHPKKGDIVLNKAYHVIACIDNNERCGWASIDENGNARGGKAGDQGNETKTGPYYEYRRGWDCYLRWGGSDAQANPYPVNVTYVTLVDCLNVRTGPSTDYSEKAKADLTEDGQKHSNDEGELNLGTAVTVLETAKDTYGNTWGRIPSGWICLEYKGRAYVRLK